MKLLYDFILKFNSKKVGVDEFGNKYFIKNNNKRIVIYNGIAEATKIPAEWHVWLHYITNQIPVNINTNKYSWQKIHHPNLTGTKNAYNPTSTITQKKLHYESFDINNFNNLS